MSAPFEPIVVRASSLANYADCNRRGAARLFWKEIRDAGFTLNRSPRGIGAIVGTAVHAGAAGPLDEKARTGTLPPPSVAMDIARDKLTAELLKPGTVVYEAPPRGTTLSQNEAVRQATNMARMYAVAVAPEVEPILVETRLEAEVEPGLVLSGQPDLVAREPGSVRDLKTGARATNAFAAQLGAYSLLSRTHGLEIETASIDFLQRVRPDKPQPNPFSRRVHIAAAETAAANIMRRIALDLDTFRNGDAERRIQPGDPWSFVANPSSILCSKRWCPAWGTDFCHEGNPDTTE